MSIAEIGSVSAVILRSSRHPLFRGEAIQTADNVQEVLTKLWGVWNSRVVSPATFEVGRHLIEELKNPMVVRARPAWEVFSIRPMGVRDANWQALADTEGSDVV